MIEMMWLGADFVAERKRQVQLGKKCSMSIRQWHNNKESRRLRELGQAEAKRRKLAAKLGRECKKQFWSKLERVISYKQKLHADEERKKAMNKQLVVLVRQTEKYTESLSRQVLDTDDSDGNDDDDDTAMDVDTDGSSINNESASQSDGDGINSGNSSDARSKKRHGGGRRTQMTIEEALAAGRSRKTKSRIVDYSRMKLDATDFYGESTASDGSGSDGSFSLVDESESDDEETLRAAIEEELHERRQFDPSQPQGQMIFLADPEELRQLHEERSMDIDEVLQRLQQEGRGAEESDGRNVTHAETKGEKRVHFAEPEQATIDACTVSTHRERRTSLRSRKEPPAPNSQAQSPQVDPGADADDDGDASDVEDYFDESAAVSNDADGEEEYQVVDAEADDETTIAQEESLPKDMSYKEEIALLQQEADLSIEELRKKYGAIEAGQDETHDDQSNSGNENSDANVDEIGNDEGEEEFVVDEKEVDDEATMAQEESLPRDMSYKEEIDLLNAEADMSLEELRREDGTEGNDRESAEKGKDDGSSGDEVDSVNQDDEEEFVADEQEVDDETTMAAEEQLPREMTYEEEITLLQTEANLSVEELRRKYAAMDEGSGEAAEDAHSNDEDDDESADSHDSYVDTGDDEEFEPPSLNEVDDETTIEAEEKMAREISYDEEISLLERENNMSVEELKAMYSGLYADTPTADTRDIGRGSDDDDIKASAPSKPEVNDSELKRKRETVDENPEDEISESDAKRRKELHLESDDGTEALNALEASAEKARQTLATRPFLLANWVKLRKYQQVGLNWLVSMQSRRLNGILADGTF
jgi:HSA